MRGSNAPLLLQAKVFRRKIINWLYDFTARCDIYNRVQILGCTSSKLHGKENIEWWWNRKHWREKWKENITPMKRMNFFYLLGCGYLLPFKLHRLHRAFGFRKIIQIIKLSNFKNFIHSLHLKGGKMHMSLRGIWRVKTSTLTFNHPWLFHHLAVARAEIPHSNGVLFWQTGY